MNDGKRTRVVCGELVLLFTITLIGPRGVPGEAGIVRLACDVDGATGEPTPFAPGVAPPGRLNCLVCKSNNLLDLFSP